MWSHMRKWVCLVSPLWALACEQEIEQEPELDPDAGCEIGAAPEIQIRHPVSDRWTVFEDGDEFDLVDDFEDLNNRYGPSVLVGWSAYDVGSVVDALAIEVAIPGFDISPVEVQGFHHRKYIDDIGWVQSIVVPIESELGRLELQDVVEGKSIEISLTGPWCDTVLIDRFSGVLHFPKTEAHP